MEIYTDGACSGNPGPGGWAAIILDNSDDDQGTELYGGAPQTTNNRMEMSAVIHALKHLSADQDVILYTDSTYVKDGITRWIKGWKKNGWRTSQRKPVKNQDLWQSLDQESMRVNIEWRWVKGHAGNRWNERADYIARQGLTRAIEEK